MARFENGKHYSGKIQRPGPDTPGGPRCKRNCDVCGVEFWPRVVDVERGWGRHCSSNCSSKALRKPKVYQVTCKGCGEEFETKKKTTTWHLECRHRYQIEQTGKVVCNKCGRGKPCGSGCTYCTWLADKERRKKVARGACSKMTPEEFAALRGCSGTTVRNAIRTTLAKAWDGKYIDASHPAAMDYAAKPVRELLGRVEIACAHCGKQKEIFASHRKKGDRFFCDLKCSGEYHKTYELRTCELPGCDIRVRAIQFDIKQGRGRFCCPEHAHEFSKLNAPKYDVAGVGFTMRELVEASGRSSSFIVDRLRAGMSAARAIVDSEKPRGRRRKHETPTG